MAGSRVHVSIPFEVAADLKTFKGAIGSVLDKLGCQACCSGHDIHFHLQRNFLIDDAAKVGSFPGRFGRELGSQPAVRASLSPKAGEKIATVNKIIDQIAGQLGCQACCSGHDIRFTLERNLVLDRTLNVQETAVAFG